MILNSKMKIKNFLILFFFIVVQYQFTFAQLGIGAGGGMLYNTKFNYIGISARAIIPVTKNLYAVPYGYYYFSEAKVLGGLSALVPFYQYSFFNFYAVASGTLNGNASVNATGTTVVSSNGKTVSTASTASAKSGVKADGEGGFGAFIGNNCLKGYIEPRYAIKQDAFLIHSGLIYFFSCKKGNSKKGSFSRGKKRKTFKSNDRGKEHCPAYN